MSFGPPGSPPPRSRDRFIRRMVLLNLVALAAAYMSGHWDAAMHARGAVEEFWYPPHYGIYFGLGTAAGVSVAGLAILARSPGPSSGRLRGNAALVLIVVANTIGFTGAPFDAWWHATFGIDLSVWSPPHLHLLVGMVLAAIAASVYFLDTGPVASALRALRSLDPRAWMAVVAIVVGLLLAAFLFFEYEAGLPNAELLARPSWTYPVSYTGFAGFAIALSAGILRIRGAATVVAAVYVLARLGVLGVDRGLLGFDGAVPYPLLVPAIAFDLYAAYAWEGGGIRFPSAYSAGGGALASIAVVLTAPPFWSAVGIFPTILVEPWSSAWPFAVLAGTAGSVAGWWSGTALRRLRPPSADMPMAVVAAEPA